MTAPDGSERCWLTCPCFPRVGLLTSVWTPGRRRPGVRVPRCPRRLTPTLTTPERRDAPRRPVFAHGSPIRDGAARSALRSGRGARGGLLVGRDDSVVIDLV